MRCARNVLTGHAISRVEHKRGTLDLRGHAVSISVEEPQRFPLGNRKGPHLCKQRARSVC